MRTAKHYSLEGDEIAAVVVLKDGKSTLVAKPTETEAQRERVAITLVRAAARFVEPDVVERIAAEIAAEVTSDPDYPRLRP